jgi:hypothetical protein
MSKYIFHSGNLYKVLDEQDNIYELQRLNRVCFDELNTSVSFKINTIYDYIMFCKFEEDSKNKSIIFSKSQTNYLIIEYFDIQVNHLVVIYEDNTFKTRIVNSTDIIDLQYECLLKNILDNVDSTFDAYIKAPNAHIKQVLRQKLEELNIEFTNLGNKVFLAGKNRIFDLSLSRIISMFNKLIPIGVINHDDYFENEVEVNENEEDNEKQSLSKEQINKIKKIKIYFKIRWFQKIMAVYETRIKHSNYYY